MRSLSRQVSTTLRRSRRRAVVPLVVCLAAPSAASAATPEELGRADALFKEGLRFFDGGQTEKACAKFDDSYKLDPALGTLQNLAICHEKQGKLSLAFGEFVDLLAKAQTAGKTPRVDVAKEHLAGLDAKVTRVQLTLGDVTDAAVEIDGTARDWHAPIPLDPGHHIITAHAPGRPDVHLEWDATAPGTQAVPVVFPPSPSRAPTPTPLPPAPPPPPAAQGPSKPLVFTLGGVGAAGIVAGSIFGVLTLTEKSAGLNHCSGKYCDASGLSSENAAHTSATISTIAFGVGLAALAVDAVILLTTKGGKSSDSTAWSLDPGGGFALAF